MKVYKFGNCYLNTTERRVIKDDKYLELTTKTFDVLQVLIENCGEIVTKDEILGKVWNGSFVEEGNLAVHIPKLRRLLGANKTKPFIETVQGTGYRFVSSVKAVNDAEWQKHLPAESRLQSDKSCDEFVFDSIAVLPLDNESGAPQIEYLADGLTEGFINSLSHNLNLRVIARNTVFRYKNKDADAKEVGETLGVAAVLTGRIRVVKDNLMISVELTKTEDGRQLWGTQINQPFSDIIEVLEKITSAVSEKLKTEIGAKNSATNLVTHNSESYRLYLKGKHFLQKRTEEDIHKAIEYFQKSVSIDPTNVHSYVEMVECYRLLYIFDYIAYKDFSSKTEPLLSAVSELNQSVDVVQAMYGAKAILEWKFEEAEKHILDALRLNPDCLIAHYRYADFLMTTGRFSDALKELNQIMRIDPLSLITYMMLSRAFYRIGQYENAMIYLNDALELEANNYEALALLGAVLTELGNYPEALRIFRKSLDIHYNIEVFSMLGYAHALEGKKDEAYEIIRQIQSQSKSSREYSAILSKIYLALGENEIAYEFLERSFEQHEMDLFLLASDPRWAKISNEPRFEDLIKRIGIPVKLSNMS